MPDQRATKTASTVAARVEVTTTSITLGLPVGCRKFRVWTPPGSPDLRVRPVAVEDRVDLDATDVVVRADVREEVDTYPLEFVAIAAASGSVTVVLEALDAAEGSTWSYGTILEIPTITSPLLFLDAGDVEVSGSNVTAWSDLAGQRPDAVPLVGTPTLATIDDVLAVNMPGGQTMDGGGAPGALPGTSSFMLYVAVRLALLSGSGDAQYPLGQYYATDAGRAYFGYSGGANRLVLGVGASSKQLVGRVPAAATWEIWTFAFGYGDEIVIGIEEYEETFTEDMADITSLQGNQIGGLSTTGGAYNTSSLFTLRGAIAHMSAWAGVHTPAQRVAMRAAIRARHGL